MDSQDEGLDTKLARLLHQRGRVDLGVLQSLLSEARGGQATLAGSLVDRGLLAHGEAQALVAELQLNRSGEGVDSSLWSSGEQVATSVSWREGVQVGDYRLDRKLGQGAMGMVFQATHLPTLSTCALKTLSFQADEELRERFVREGQAQARVDSHPNVVRVHTAGEVGGSLYMVMDLASGGDLQERLRRGPLPPEEAARVVAALARGLAHVHGHGVLHRDLKPANVLFDEADVPKLVDFGLARIAGEASSLTRTGDTLGTPSYMAPEQAQGLRGEVDARSDVYGLGAILYHCLTGSPPFVGTSAMAILTRVIMEEPEPPRALVEEVPAALEAICLKSLAKDADARYPDAASLAEALETFSEPAGKLQAGANALLIKVGAGALAFSAVLALLGVAVVSGRGPSSDSTSQARTPRYDAAPRTDSADSEAPAPTAPRLVIEPFGFDEGERFRGRLRAGGRQLSQAEGSPAPMELSAYAMTVDFLFSVDSVSGRQANVSAVIEGLALQRTSATATIAFVSSAEALDPPSPFRKALGERLSLVVDRFTGEIEEVHNTREVQFTVWAEARRQGLKEFVYSIEGFSEPAAISSALNKVLHVFPKGKIPEDGRWTLVAHDFMAKRIVHNAPAELRMFGGELLHDVRRLKDERHYTARAEGDGLTLAWEGEDEIRKIHGTVRLEGGRIVRAHAKERFAIRFGDLERDLTALRIFVEAESHYELLSRQ